MALDGANTAALEMYSDENARSDRYAKARAKVQVVEKELKRHVGAVAIETRDGRTFVGEVDVGQPAQDTQAQWGKLTHKAATIMTPVIGADRCQEVVDQVSGLASATSIKGLMKALS